MLAVSAPAPRGAFESPRVLLVRAYGVKVCETQNAGCSFRSCVLWVDVCADMHSCKDIFLDSGLVPGSSGCGEGVFGRQRDQLGVW